MPISIFYSRAHGKGVRAVCHECAKRESSLTVANADEEKWEKYPIAVEVRKCRQCKRYRHWWYFVDRS